MVYNGSAIASFTASYAGDCDGDCLADLVLLSGNTFNFMRGSPGNKYSWVGSYTSKDAVQHFTFQDISTNDDK